MPILTSSHSYIWYNLLLDHLKIYGVYPSSRFRWSFTRSCHPPFPIVSCPHQHDCLRNQADTPGCTNQACGFRDHLSEIKELGYDIYGLSKDKPAALKRVRPLVLLLVPLLLLICHIRMKPTPFLLANTQWCYLRRPRSHTVIELTSSGRPRRNWILSSSLIPNQSW